MLKSELITNAYAELRIWGVTTASDPEDTVIALRKLEAMMAELEDQRGLCIGYNFTTTPDVNDDSGVDIMHEEMVQYNLATRLIPAFNKQVPPELHALAGTTLSGAIGQSMKKRMRQVSPPSRMPRGSGNRIASRYSRFNDPVSQPENTCDTIRMSIGDIGHFVEDFSAYLNGETITNYTMVPTNGLTLTPDYNAQEVLSDVEWLVDADLLIPTGTDYPWTSYTGVTVGGGEAEWLTSNAVLTQDLPGETTLYSYERYRAEIESTDIPLGETKLYVGGAYKGTVPASGLLIVDDYGNGSTQFKMVGTSNIGGKVTRATLKKYIPGLTETYISYTAEANTGADKLQSVTLTITTSSGRVYKRVVEFEVS